MKIGILTFPKAINYGTALQAVALYKLLNDRGHDVYFIDHTCEAIERDNSVFDFKSAKSPKYTAAHLLNLNIALKRKNNFNAFQSEFMRFSDAPFDSYDVVVAGSDQIWNYNLTGSDYLTYYLDFNKKNTLKVSYAGSFGLNSLDNDKKERISSLLSDFDYLSVREKRAADIIYELIGQKPFVALDPTLLLTSVDWRTFFKSEQTDRYIFVYTVFNDDKLWHFAEQLSKKTGLPIKTISYSKIHTHKAETDFTSGPDKWLDYMFNASYVVTNSFHGTAFSVNFHKDFYFNVPENGKAVGSRLFDLTALYGLSDRNLSLDSSPEAVNWDEVEKNLSKDREESSAFIDSFLK